MSGFLNPYLDKHFSEIIYDVRRYFPIVSYITTVAFVNVIVLTADIENAWSIISNLSVKQFNYPLEQFAHNEVACVILEFCW